MTREEYIEAIIKIFRAKYKPSEIELEEVKLALEMMPDRPIFVPKKDGIEWPGWPPQNPYEKPVVVMYGCSMPDTWWNANQSTFTPTEDKKENKDESENTD